MLALGRAQSRKFGAAYAHPMDILIKASQLLLSLSILVVLHELGHFLPAKWFNTRVEKFYLFFNPWFSLFKVKRGDTEYGIGWLPLGGYVKISGMVDESMDKEAMAQEPQPWEFRSKPAWQRLIIMLGGVTVNLVLGFFIFSMVLFTWGEDEIAPENVTNGYHFHDTLEERFGFQEGDNLIKIDGVAQEHAGDFRPKLLLDDVQAVTVSRGGREVVIALPEDFGQLLLDSGIKSPFVERIPSIVDTVTAGSRAELAGLLKGDRLVGVADEKSPYHFDLVKAIRDNKNTEISLYVERDGSPVTLTVTPDEDGTIGFRPKGKMSDYFEIEHISYSFMESWGAGFRHARGELRNYAISLKFLFTKSGIQQIGGFGTIGGIFDSEWNWEVFWDRTAWLSLVLAFMNVLPIPALDGGHVLFLLVEMISGRKPSDKFLERAQMVGMILLLSLMLYANGMDVVRAWFS